MPADLALLQPGDAVCAWGVVGRDDDGDWFQPSLPVPLVADYPRVEPHWKGTVPLVGADVEALAQPTTVGHRVKGAALVTGRWTGEAVHVSAQSLVPGPQPSWPEHPVPPCPPPACG